VGGCENLEGHLGCRPPKGEAAYSGEGAVYRSKSLTL